MYYTENAAFLENMQPSVVIRANKAKGIRLEMTLGKLSRHYVNCSTLWIAKQTAWSCWIMIELSAQLHLWRTVSVRRSARGAF